jgi:murein DD-endopeptidase MepM/ murein hydrolase activator NlpD
MAAAAEAGGTRHAPGAAYDLVPVADIDIRPDFRSASVDLRELFTSGDIPDAVLVADDALTGSFAAADIAQLQREAARLPSAPSRSAPSRSAPSRSNDAASKRAPPREAARPDEARRNLPAHRPESRPTESRPPESRPPESRPTARHPSAPTARKSRRGARGAKSTERWLRKVADRAVRPAFSARYGMLAANGVAAFGLAAAIGAAAWYAVAVPGQRPVLASGLSTVAAAAIDPRTTSAIIPASAPGLSLPEIGKASLLAVGDVENASERRSFQRVVRVRRGDNFFVLLMRSGVPGAEAQQANISLAGVYDVRKMRAGQLVTVTFGILGEDHNRFLGVRFDTDIDRSVTIQRQPHGDFTATEIKKELTTRLVRNNGTINHSVFQGLLQSGLPAEPVIRMINLFAYDVDFQRDIQKGDTFETLVEQQRDAHGNIVRYGDILYASLTVGGRTYKLYRWQNEDGSVDYLNEHGESSRKALMRTPIDGARISSGFGLRRHPILGYSRMHTGVDFAAPKGTPIYAAGSGDIMRIGWLGGYGNAIMIHHNKEYDTLYGHMSGFVPGMKVGRHVKQGDVIGYVGATGMATGPHLHYEVHYDGKPINPLTLKLPARQRLVGADLKRFQAMVKDLDSRYRTLARNGATGGALAMANEQEADTGCVNGVRLDPTDKRACN